MSDNAAVVVGIVAVVLVLVGAQSCAVITNRQCEETRRAAINSSDLALRTLALSRQCQ